MKNGPARARAVPPCAVGAFTARQQRQLQREVLNGINLACLYVISPSSYYSAIKYASLAERAAQAL